MVRPNEFPDPCLGNLTIAYCLGIGAGAMPSFMVWLKSMLSSFRFSAPRLTAAAAVGGALLAIAIPSAAGAPASDGQGYVDSTARCAAPSTAVVFGSTATSRVAICKTAAGQYEYRGVRVSDGAKLITSASRNSDGAFVAENDGITYTVTSSSLVVSVGKQVIRQEPMVDFHGPQSSSSSTTPTATSTPTSTAATPTSTATPTPTTSATPTPTTPLPPPLPAEVGGSTH